MKPVYVAAFCLGALYVFWTQDSNFGTYYGRGGDFVGYLEAVHGKRIWYVEGLDIPLQWRMKEYMVWFFTPFSWLPFPVAYAIWFLLLAGSTLILIARLSQIRPLFGWLAIPLCLYAIKAGNITMLLAALCLTPLGAVCATLVKPYLVLFTLRRWYYALAGIIAMLIAWPAPEIMRLGWQELLITAGHKYIRFDNLAYLITAFILWSEHGNNDR